MPSAIKLATRQPSTERARAIPELQAKDVAGSMIPRYGVDLLPPVPPRDLSMKGAIDTMYPWWWDEREFPRRAVMTEWFYNPLKGQPRYVDVYRMRQLAVSEWVWMCTSTIIEEVCQVPWEVIPKRAQWQEDTPDQVLREIDYVTYFLNNPNDNKNETINTIMRAYLRECLELDAGCLVKGFSARSYDTHPAGGLELRRQGQRELVELFARDGGSFLKETDVNGIEYRYWQYSYLHPAVAPIEFDTNEVVYSVRYPRAYSVYGWAELQSMETILNLLINSAFTNATMFQEYAVPSGVVSVMGSAEDEQRMRGYFQSEIQGRFHKVAIVNRDVKFTPFTYTARDLEFLKGQEWFSKLVWAIYKLTPTELGFQDEIRETGKAMAAQSRIQKRKAVMPLLALIEQVLNNQVINEFTPRLKFQFKFTDKEEEWAESELEMMMIKEGLMTINEWRKKRKKGPPVPWGDEPLQLQIGKGMGGGLGGQQGGSMLPDLSPDVAKPSRPDTLGQGIRQVTAEEKAIMEGVKAWGGRPHPSWDFADKDDRATPVFSRNDRTGQMIQLPDQQFQRPRRREQIKGWVDRTLVKVKQVLGAMGYRPDDYIRDGMLLPGETPDRTPPQERIDRLRKGSQDEARYGEQSRDHEKLDKFRGGMGAHKWERDETNRGIAMGTDVDPRDAVGARRLTGRLTQDPITDVENRIVPTPPIRAGPILYPRDVPPVEGSTGFHRKPKKELKTLPQESTGALGPQRTVMGAIPRHWPDTEEKMVFYRDEEGRTRIIPEGEEERVEYSGRIKEVDRLMRTMRGTFPPWDKQRGKELRRYHSSDLKNLKGIYVGEHVTSEMKDTWKTTFGRGYEQGMGGGYYWEGEIVLGDGYSETTLHHEMGHHVVAAKSGLGTTSSGANLYRWETTPDPKTGIPTSRQVSHPLRGEFDPKVSAIGNSLRTNLSEYATTNVAESTAVLWQHMVMKPSYVAAASKTDPQLRKMVESMRQLTGYKLVPLPKKRE